MPKTRKVTQRIVKVTKEMLQKQMRVPLSANQKFCQLSTYDNFVLKTVEMGTLLWRLHTPDKNYFILNEYTGRGEILPNSFVELTCTHNPQDLCVCTCDVYKAIASIASSEQHQEEESVLPDGILCLHCRFFNEHVLPCLPQLLPGATAVSRALQPLEAKLHKSADKLNDPVVLLTHGSGTKKYSVRPATSDKCGIVHVANSGIMAMCTQGSCQAAQKHKKSVKRLLELAGASSLCEHLATMHSNRELWEPQGPSRDEEIDPQSHEEVDQEEVDNNQETQEEEEEEEYQGLAYIPV